MFYNVNPVVLQPIFLISTFAAVANILTIWKSGLVSTSITVCHVCLSLSPHFVLCSSRFLQGVLNHVYHGRYELNVNAPLDSDTYRLQVQYPNHPTEFILVTKIFKGGVTCTYKIKEAGAAAKTKIIRDDCETVVSDIEIRSKLNSFKLSL